MASVIGLQYGTVSNLLSATRDQRPSYLTAKTIEILTNGEITVDEMMVSPAEIGEIEQRIADQWPEFHKN